VEAFEGQEGLKKSLVVDEASHPDTEGTVDDGFLVHDLFLLFLDSQHGADHLE